MGEALQRGAQKEGICAGDEYFCSLARKCGQRGLPAGRIIGLPTALPAKAGMNYFMHTSQQKSTCWLLFLE